MASDMAALSHIELVERCTKLEAQLAIQTAKVKELTDAARAARGRTPSPKSGWKKSDTFDPNRHATRFIALKLSYLGHRYNGFEHANRCFTPLPTIEEVLWKALRKARLISPPVPEGADTGYEVTFDPRAREAKYFIYGKTKPEHAEEKLRLDISWDGCQYSKCGRTDKGVSAFGQVIGIRVRSNAPVERSRSDNLDVSGLDEDEDLDGLNGLVLDEPPQPFDPIKDELPYVHMLNQLLPPDVRILAWCPFPPDGFDARYSCLERRYKYFFTNPAFCPTPGPLGLKNANGTDAVVREGWLDIDRMRDAARRLQGLHDYRNLCVLDASKQMPNCQRRINYANIEEFEGTPPDFYSKPDLNRNGKVATEPWLDETHTERISSPRVYTLTLHGTAFLWHQVRCIAAVLFLIGQGLESPSVIDELLDIQTNPGKPHYGMADDAPLVLWDCVFPGDEDHGENSLKWIYAGDDASISALNAKGDGKFGVGGLVEDLFAQWQDAKLKEAQIGGILALALSKGDQSSLQRGGMRDPEAVKARSQKVFEGTGKARLVGAYQSLMSRRSMDSLEILNAKYMSSVKGVRRQAKREASTSNA